MGVGPGFPDMTCPAPDEIDTCSQVPFQGNLKKGVFVMDIGGWKMRPKFHS